MSTRYIGGFISASPPTAYTNSVTPGVWTLEEQIQKVYENNKNVQILSFKAGVDPEATIGNSDTRGNEEYFSTAPMRYFTLRMNFNF